MSKNLKLRRVALPIAAVLAVSIFTALPQQPTKAVAAACPAGYMPAGAEMGHMASYDTAALNALTPSSQCVSMQHPESLVEQRALAAQRYSMQTAPDGIVPSGAFGRAYKQRTSLLKNRRNPANTKSWQPIGQGPLQAGDDGYSGVNFLGWSDIAGRITDFYYVPATDKYYPDTLLASMSYGGVWITDQNVNRWASIGDSLPTQVMGSVAYTPANGGTIIALSGDGSFGADSREGDGVFYTTNGGQTWSKGIGVPDDTFGFKLAVDQSNPRIVYAATGAGLYRSKDGGKNWANVNLPTDPNGSCTGKTNRTPGCLFANVVTDVAVMAPGGFSATGADNPGGKVLAAVGWRGGNRRNPDGTVQAPGNGIYTSDTGEVGSFTRSPALGFVSQNRTGRIQIGAAIGPAQDHNIIYAIVQDAVLIRRGLPYIDAPTGDSPTDAVSQAVAGTKTESLFQSDSLTLAATRDCKAANDTANVPAAATDPVTGAVDSVVASTGDPAGIGAVGQARVPYRCQGVPGVPTVLNGIYVSPDWGQHWVLMSDATALQNPANGSALTGTTGQAGYAPGVQAWYNVWIHPDPTMAKAGVPTRVLFGLEEVWESDGGGLVPQAGPSSFHVIGRYWFPNSCTQTFIQLPVLGGTPPCPTQPNQGLTARTTTTHPDQHAGIFVPTFDGNVRVVVGNDGGVYQQLSAGGSDYSNANWGNGAQNGFNTLLPYDAQRSADGTVWMGLQDNGTAKIVDIVKNGHVTQKERQIMTFGGDGFFVAVHPQDGNIAYEEYVGGTMSVTVDGGHTWAGMSPPISNAQFSNPFVMDPKDPNHLMIAGRQVVETTAGPGTGTDGWKTVFNLGTAHHLGDPNANVPFTDPFDPVNQMTAIDVLGAHSYVGFCGTCDVLNNPNKFQNGIATNVGGSKPAKVGTSNGWHIAKAKGLPNRYITGIAIDPANPRNVVVSLGGYLRLWTPVPGNATAPGHLYMSNDGGNTFRNITGNLPDTPINWVLVRGNQQIVATDIGVYISDAACPAGKRGCTRFQVLGNNLPMAPVFTIRKSAGDPNMIIAALYGRGVYAYHLGPAVAAVHKAKLPDPKFLGQLVHDTFAFETDAEGWAVDTNGTTEWRHVAPGNNSAGSMSAAPYLDSEATSMTSPKMTVPARSLIHLTWEDRRDTEPCCDYMTVQWSSDNKHWNTVWSSAGQDGSYPQFGPEAVDFVAPKGSVYVRFILAADGGVSSPPYTGVAVDNVTLRR